MTKPKRVFSVSIYCRHEASVLLVQHAKLGMWVPVGGEIKRGETPLEAARRVLQEVVGVTRADFPFIHKVLGAPPGLLLYEEHEVGDKLLLSFSFVVDVPTKEVRHSKNYIGWMWVNSLGAIPNDCLENVRQALQYAIPAGRKGGILVP